MKKKSLSVAIVVDYWFPEFGSKQVHIQNVRSKLHQHFNTKTELYFAKNKNLWFQLLWPFWIVGKIIKHHKAKPYDLIHSHGVMAGLPAKVAATILRIPIVHTVHGSPYLDQKKKNFQYYIEKIILTNTRYSAQISVSKNFLKHKNSNKDIEVIPNGVSTSSFDAIRAKKNKNPMLIWVGKNIPEKGVAVLKEAIGRVRKKLPKLETELVTGGRLKGEKLIRAYKRSHVFVLPSLAEGQPITLLEAFAAKLPVIATNVGDNTKIVIDGVNGILIEPDNTTQLTKAILKILRSRNKGRNLGMSGYRLVKKQYSWGNVAKQTYGVYKKVMKTA